MTGAGRSAAGAALGAAVATAASVVLRRLPPGGARRWARLNHRGEPVTLLQGPAVAAGAVGAALLAPGLAPEVRAAGAVAGLAAGALGAYDDLAGSGDARGFRGHLGALRRGEVTTGAVKILGIGLAGLLAAGLVRRRPVDALVGGAVVAGTANLANLLDLRPGRATKAALLAGATQLRSPAGALAAGALGAAAALLPDDLHERSMLGDAGANALGAVLGVAAVAGASRRGLLARLAVLAALTAASEQVSFSRVIDATPGLRHLDRLGRRTTVA